MNFSAIVRKNFIHHFNKYISFYFVNSLIMTMLFMYGSLIYNDYITQTVGLSSLNETLNITLIGLIIFSILFITYTNISFLKNRGKEFGMYLTLGMTTKDLSKLIAIENLGIMLVSLVTGIIGGTLFGRLFYMILNKVLRFTAIPYELNYQSFLLSIGVFTLIFICNVIFNLVYIKKVSIIDAIKANQKKEVGKSNLVIGAISLILFMVSIYCLPKTLLKVLFDGSSMMITLFVAILILAPYVIIGSGIQLIKVISSKIPSIYNRNLIVFSNLSHRFLAYKNMLYMLSILLAGAVFYVGYSYSLYSYSRESIEIENPFEIMFVEKEGYNQSNQKEIHQIINDQGATLEDYKVLDYIEVPVFKEHHDELIFWSDSAFILSETNYNQHMGTNVELRPNEAMDITVSNEALESESQTLILTPLDEEQLEEVQDVSAQTDYRLNRENFNQIVRESFQVVINKEKVRTKKNIPFINVRYSSQGMFGDAIVLDDDDYQLLKDNLKDELEKKVHLMNVKNGDQAFEGILDYLKEVNALNDSYWLNGNLWGAKGYGERAEIENYRPIYVEELVKLKIEDSGIIFFTMMFIGILFVVANGVVLYYKVLSDIDSEAERIMLLKRIGMTTNEIKQIISKELAITFFIPILIGGGLGLYFLYIMVMNSGMDDLLMKKAVMVWLLGVLIQFAFYLISKREYIKKAV